MSAGSTTVRYGDIIFTNCLTKRFEQEAVFDDSGTDLLYYKFTIRIVGYVHGHSNWVNINIFPITTNLSAASHHRKFRPVLLEPRARFEMRLGTSGAGAGGQVLLFCAPATSSGLAGIPETTKEKDLNNGPKGKILSVANISADELIKVEAEFEICKLECGESDGESGNRSGVLNNRWSCIDDINENFYTTRTFAGRLRLSTSLINPHSFRDWVVPGLQYGMRREKMTFTASEDGLMLDYTVVDKEVTFAAPAPATSWRVRHTESLGENAMFGYAEMDITLAGDRDVDKGELLAIAASVIEAKLVTRLNNRDIQDKHIDRILQFSITDTFGSDQNNSISIHCRVQHMQEVNDVFPMQVEKFSVPIDASVIDDYRRDVSRGNITTETEGPIPMLSAFVSFLQSPCSKIHAIQAVLVPTSRLSAGVNHQTGLITIGVQPIREFPSDPSEWMSQEHQIDNYTYWKMETTYNTRGHKVQLPIASGPSTSSADVDKPTSVTVLLTNPTATRTVRIDGQRVGAWPVLPTPEDYIDGNGIIVKLLDFKILPSVPQRDPDGAQIYRAAAEYIYSLSRPLRKLEKVRVGINPWDNLGIHFVQGLLSGEEQ